MSLAIKWGRWPRSSRDQPSHWLRGWRWVTPVCQPAKPPLAAPCGDVPQHALGELLEAKMVMLVQLRLRFIRPSVQDH